MYRQGVLYLSFPIDALFFTSQERETGDTLYIGLFYNIVPN